jgi:hypothetical protein
MSSLEAAHPVYTRSTPAEWGDLLASTQDSLNTNEDSLTPNATNVTSVLQELSTLDGEALDTNRYYALGLAICGVARSLQQPEIRAKTVKWSARNIFENPYSERDPSDPFSIDEVTAFSMHYPFRQIARDAVNSLPSETHLLADCLNSAASSRQYTIKYDHGSSENIEEWRAEKILDGNLTADIIALNTTAATLSTLRRAVKLVRSSSESEDHTFGLEGDIAIIRSQNWRNVLANFAALRLDEFTDSDEDGKSQFMDISPDGTVVFRKDRRNSELAPPNQPSADDLHVRAILHEKRLKCPALHVSGMLRLMQDIVPEILEAAEEMRQEKVKEKEQYISHRDTAVTYTIPEFLAKKSASMKRSSSN